MSEEPDYNAMHPEEFDEILGRIVDDLSAKALFRIPGIYEILAEEFNDEVLDIWWGEVNG